MYKNQKHRAYKFKNIKAFKSGSIIDRTNIGFTVEKKLLKVIFIK